MMALQVEVPDQLIAYLHNGFAVKVSGNERGILVLKDLLIPNLEVKGIVTYRGEGSGPHLEKLSQLNYTQLKELRKL